MGQPFPDDVTIWDEGRIPEADAGDPPIPDGLTGRLNLIAGLVPHGSIPADRQAALRANIREWKRRLARLEAEAREAQDRIERLWGDWRATAEFIDEAEAELNRIRSG